MDEMMDECCVMVGDRVRTVNEENTFFEKLQQYHNLAWTQRMAMYIGKIGIVKEIAENGIQVSFFSWSPADVTASSDGKTIESGRNRVVEATYTWYPKLIVPANEIHLVDGDRAIMIRNKDMKSAAMVSVRVIDSSDGTLSLRMPHSTAFIWKQIDNPNDVILPVYTGHQLVSLMRDRNLPQSLSSLNSDSSRVVFGLPASSYDDTSFIESIFYWSRTGDQKPFRLALHRNPELKNATVNGRCALMIACDIGLWPAAAILLCLGAEKSVYDSHGNGLLHLAAQNGHERVLEGLLIFGADEVNCRNLKGEVPLQCAVRAASVACVDRLLNTPGIDPNIQDLNGNTALHILSKMDESVERSTMIHRMLSNIKVDQLIVNRDGLTPLQVAVVAGQAKVVQSMIQMRPSLLVSEGCEAMLPLHLAAAYGCSSVLDTILKISSDASKTTKANRTALHFAVERWDGSADRDMQRLACIQLLISHGVPLNVRDCNGSTALHLAINASTHQVAISNQKIDHLCQLSKPNTRLEEIASVIRPHWTIAVVCFLLAQGSDPQTKDRNGNTPADLIIQPSFAKLFDQFAAFRSRACVAMSSSVERMFDSSGVTMCAFNCEDNIADTVLIPCGHRVVCTRCVGNTLIRRCPLCYQQITGAKNLQDEKLIIGINLTKPKETENDVDVECEGDENRLRRGENISNKKVIDEVQMWKIAQEAAERAKKAAEEEKEEVVRELRDKLERLEMEVCCAICMDQRSTIAFQCGHTACANCSNSARLKSCHLCRQPIKRRTTLYN